ncbi:hypothetical protein CLF_108120 [Clonorchis sinensis]|uniref:Uncharacterized protein n=1 Tax=Clonorchis sinensis TaxID=79923 RepID=G7YHM4_CLOSI|nr:hypothetical protein CLF_108120 [Clonorchis sinensis]
MFNEIRAVEICDEHRKRETERSEKVNLGPFTGKVGTVKTSYARYTSELPQLPFRFAPPHPVFALTNVSPLPTGMCWIRQENRSITLEKQDMDADVTVPAKRRCLDAQDNKERENHFYRDMDKSKNETWIKCTGTKRDLLTLTVDGLNESDCITGDKSANIENYPQETVSSRKEEISQALSSPETNVTLSGQEANESVTLHQMITARIETLNQYFGTMNLRNGCPEVLNHCGQLIECRFSTSWFIDDEDSFSCNILSVPNCCATRKKHEGWDTGRLPKPSQGESRGRGRVRTTDLPSLNMMAQHSNKLRCELSNGMRQGNCTCTPLSDGEKTSRHTDCVGGAGDSKVVWMDETSFNLFCCRNTGRCVNGMHEHAWKEGSIHLGTLAFDGLPNSATSVLLNKRFLILSSLRCEPPSVALTRPICRTVERSCTFSPRTVDTPRQVLLRGKAYSEKESVYMSARLQADLFSICCQYIYPTNDDPISSDHLQTYRQLKNARDFVITKPDKVTGVILSDGSDNNTYLWVNCTIVAVRREEVDVVSQRVSLSNQTLRDRSCVVVPEWSGNYCYY